MTNACWTPELAIDDSQIDFQHRQLLETMEELESAIAKADHHQVAEIGGFLRQYVIVHFTDEERACELAGWPGLPEHRALHGEFRTHLAALNKALADGDLVAGREMLEYLSLWLVEHIRGADREFVAAVRSLRARVAPTP